MTVRSLRSIWLSDVHLGSRACRADLLLDFLRRTDCEQLYLVGDIIDLEHMRRGIFWPPSHTEVLRLLLAKARNGTRIGYIPGNRDDDFRTLAGTRFGGIEIVKQCAHTTADGRQLLVLHGDESCTALTEDETGRLELVEWPQRASARAACAALAHDAA